MTNNIDYIAIKEKPSLRDFSCSSMVGFLCKGSFEILIFHSQKLQSILWKKFEYALKHVWNYIEFKDYTKISYISIDRGELLFIKIFTKFWDNPNLTVAFNYWVTHDYELSYPKFLRYLSPSEIYEPIFLPI